MLREVGDGPWEYTDIAVVTAAAGGSFIMMANS